ncbi:TPA: fimbrial protein [Salmonella enterica]|nr:fimbrial protein [Salmonella enterica]ECJ2353613.1 type 1 fimbrial protein [Salmonella enterica subsp. salamae serovar Sofia]HER1262667.1 type 1 fimbrial protein [Salmonella enterica subsp. enterica serovar 28:e,h:z6]ECK3803926.1 type 1 fimbrial protein [Salmonella enterica]EDV8697629.1 type 1 fimbrial protein [Salmonella enterica]
MSRKYQLISGLMAALLLFGPGEHDAYADVNITIRGTIIEPTCSVTGADGGTRTEVNFGNVPLNAVGTDQARQPLRMNVTCDSAPPSGKTLKMYVKPVSNGTMSYSGRTVLGTSMAGLGIDLTDESSVVVTPETWVPVHGVDTGVALPTGVVTLQATLVSDDVSALTADTFTSSASVLMTYQ